MFSHEKRWRRWTRQGLKARKKPLLSSSKWSSGKWLFSTFLLRLTHRSNNEANFRQLPPTSSSDVLPEHGDSFSVFPSQWLEVFVPFNPIVLSACSSSARLSELFHATRLTFPLPDRSLPIPSLFHFLPAFTISLYTFLSASCFSFTWPSLHGPFFIQRGPSSLAVSKRLGSRQVNFSQFSPFPAPFLYSVFVFRYLQPPLWEPLTALLSLLWRYFEYSFVACLLLFKITFTKLSFSV